VRSKWVVPSWRRSKLVDRMAPRGVASLAAAATAAAYPITAAAAAAAPVTATASAATGATAPARAETASGPASPPAQR
jgi:hypothetical protein